MTDNSSHHSIRNLKWSLQNPSTDGSLMDRVLAHRNLGKVDVDESDLLNPFDLQGMSLAVERIIHAIKKQERIMIYGDYDVDGTTASAILFQCLRQTGADISVRLPNRQTHGYGLNNHVVDECAALKVKVIITVDTGTSAHKEADYAREKGIDLIVTDHHSPAETLPNAFSIINPRLSTCNYRNKELCGTAVGWKLAQAVLTKLGHNPSFAMQFIDMVALSTVCDCMPLIGENRAIVSLGLKQFKFTTHSGVQALIDACEIDQSKMSVYHLGFIIGPCINAAGRLADPMLAFKMLTGDISHAKILRDMNRERQELLKTSLEEAEKMLSCQSKQTVYCHCERKCFCHCEEERSDDEAISRATGSHSDLNSVIPTEASPQQRGSAVEESPNDIPILPSDSKNEKHLPQETNNPSNKSKTVPLIFLYKPSWHLGIIGLIAGRLCEKYNLPTIICGGKNQQQQSESSNTTNYPLPTTHYVGSCRSIPQINITDQLRKLPHLFESFGGHSQAAGFTIKAENIEVLKSELTSVLIEETKQKDLSKRLNIDAELHPSEISFENLADINRLEPFGLGNPRPRFLLRNMKIFDLRKIGKEQNHLQLKISSTIHHQLPTTNGIAFSFGEHHQALSGTKKVDIVCTLEENEWQNQKSLQLKVEDIAL